MSEKAHVSFKPTIWPMLLAPLGSMTVVTIFMVMDGRADPTALVVNFFFVAAVSYSAEMLFVVPVLLWWPSMRRPRLWVGVIWGTLVGWCFPMLAGALARMLPLAPSVSADATLLESVSAFTRLGLLGAASGLVFALAAAARVSESSN